MVKLPTPVVWGFPGGSDGKNPSAMQDTWVTHGFGRFPERGHGNPLQNSCLENPYEQRSLEGYSHGLTKSETQLSD